MFDKGKLLAEVPARKRPGPGPNKVRLPSALAMLAVNVLGNGEWRTANITIELNPVSASRPRVYRNGGVGYSKSYTKWRKEFDTLFPKGSIEGLGAGPFVMQIEHVKARPKTTKLLYPGGDLDNMDKAVMDGLQKAGAIDDDKDVVGLISTKRWTLPGEAAHSTILIMYVTTEQRKDYTAALKEVQK